LYSRLLSMFGCILWRDTSFLEKFILEEFKFLNCNFSWEIIKFDQFFRLVLLQIHFDPELPGSESIMIFPGSGSCRKFWIRPDPDPQHWPYEYFNIKEDKHEDFPPDYQRWLPPMLICSLTGNHINRWYLSPVIGYL